MTEKLRTALNAYRTNTQRRASPDFAAATLDRLGLADRYLLVESAIGPVYVAWNPRGISAVRQSPDADAFEQWFRKRFARRAFAATAEPEIVAQVRRALAGERVDLAIDLRDCTPFEAAVLRKAQEIPAGHARSYAWIAREIEHPRAVRAVGSALANNPVPLLIPCHRVVRSDYTSGQYVFGPDTKTRLLALEHAPLREARDLLHAGVHYIGQPQDNCFCLPTCGPDIVHGDFPHYHSVEEALAEGLEPCNLCRPIAA
jgi:O-6-methylguanine DNA methyltransferase